MNEHLGVSQKQLFFKLMLCAVEFLSFGQYKLIHFPQIGLLLFELPPPPRYIAKTMGGPRLKVYASDI